MSLRIEQVGWFKEGDVMGDRCYFDEAAELLIFTLLQGPVNRDRYAQCHEIPDDDR